MSENYSFNDYPFKEVKIDNIKNYLTDRGWKEVQFKREEALKFISPQPLRENEYLEILIPSRRDLIDYTRAIEIAIETISAYEDRNFEDVLSQILIFGDLLKVQISSRETRVGSIPIKSGIVLYRKVRDLLTYSACSVINPERKIFPRKLKEAEDFVESCLIGQSQYGSYSINIHCQLLRSRQLGLDGKFPLQFGRKTLLRIFSGLKDVAEATEEDSPDPIVDNYRRGLNVNMCDTLVNLIEIGSGKNLDFSADLEPKVQISEEVDTKISLQPSSEGYLVEASDILIGEIAKEKCELSGSVFLLRKKEGEEDREIRLLAITKFGEIPVAVKLDEKTYQLAIDAHKKSKPIRITGILEKIGRKWYLNEPEGLRITEGFYDFD